jgi:hypothetical protein
MLILRIAFLICIGVVLVAFTFLWVVEMIDRVSTLREYAPWLVALAEHKKWHAVVLLVCWIFLAVDASELYFKEVPEVPAPPSVTIKPPPSPTITINQIAPPAKEQCWVRNYTFPSDPNGLATMFCNSVYKPPFTLTIEYDQELAGANAIAFPVGGEFSKYIETVHDNQVTALFDLHTIIPDEPFSLTVRGKSGKPPIVKTVTLRAKGIIREFHP